ncbi:MAG: response regulator [Anaerolineales bacterium]|nr:response regulator [Anaerolineales bacterium]
MSSKPLAYIVEDYEDMVVVFSKAMERAGYEIEAARDGAVAQQRLKEIVPDVVVLDLHLPGVSGDVLLKEIRADVRMKNTRVLLTTADAAKADSLRDLADLVLLKPVSFVQLQQLAEKYFPKDK